MINVVGDTRRLCREKQGIFRVGSVPRRGVDFGVLMMSAEGGRDGHTAVVESLWGVGLNGGTQGSFCSAP